MKIARRRLLPHRGLTLYEVLLALTILLMALSVLGQHLATGTRAATNASLRTRAMLLAETKLDEILAGVEPLTAVETMPLVDAGFGWTWTLIVAPGPTVELLDITLTVQHTDEQNRIDAAFPLRRLVRDPALFVAPVVSTGTS